jgi:uncharacterized SAM-binding protein YcdF (DUF218 family)
MTSGGGARVFVDHFKSLSRKFLLNKKIFVVLLGLALILIFSHEKWLLFIGDYLIIQASLRPSTVIHVIAGEDYRTDYAIRLYKKGYGKTLFFTGGWCKKHQYKHGEHAEQRSFAQGVPQNEIAFNESTVTSTFMEAELLKEWIQQQPYPVRSIIVVSDPFHMRRARWTYKKVFGNQVQIEMAPVPFDLTSYQRMWWKDRGSRRYVSDEYQKYVYYLFRYQFSSGKFQGWLASLDKE